MLECDSSAVVSVIMSGRTSSGMQCGEVYKVRLYGARVTRKQRNGKQKPGKVYQRNAGKGRRGYVCME